MAKTITRRRFMQSSAAAGAVALAGCDGQAGAEDGDYEVWALDQGTQHLHIFGPNGDGGVEELEAHDLSAQDDRIETPHMLTFDSNQDYAVIANTAGASTAIVRVADREVVEVLETGASSHFAGITPDDETIHVDAIAAEKIVEIDVDFDAEEFEIVDELELADDDTFQDGGFSSNSPVCHEYAQDGDVAYVSIGPGFGDAGLFVLDTENLEVLETYDPDEVQANCGTIPHPSKDEFIANGGGGPDNPSPWYVIDTETHEIIEEGDTGGAGAHGLWFTPDEEELWQINRVTNDGAVYDADTYEQIDTIDEVGPGGVGDFDEIPYSPEETYENPGDKPDILSASPDGEYMFATLRGQLPQSAGGVSVGENPGVAVLDIDSRERVDLIQPADDISESDFHGINVVTNL